MLGYHIGLSNLNKIIFEMECMLIFNFLTYLSTTMKDNVYFAKHLKNLWHFHTNFFIFVILNNNKHVVTS